MEEHQEQGEWVEKRGLDLWGVRDLGGLFSLMNSLHAQDFHLGFTRRTLRFLYREVRGDCTRRLDDVPSNPFSTLLERLFGVSPAFPQLN